MKRAFLSILCLWIMLTLCQHAAAESEPDWSGLAVSSGTLIGVRYTDSGDEYGNTYSAEIGWTEDNTLALTVEESDTASQPVIFSRYSAADDTLRRIAGMVNAYDMTSWAERPDGLEVCDAGHPYLILKVLTDEGERIDYQISGYADFTDAESEAYRSVINIVRESILPDRLLESWQNEA